jgi:hypothetical protein
MTQTTTRPPATSWQQLQPPAEDSGIGWDTKTLLIGTAVGAGLGLLTSWLMVRTSRDTRGGPPHISTGDLLKVGVTTFGLMRAVAALGDN